MSALLLAAGQDAESLAADLEAAGIHVLGAVSCDQLVREAVRLAPDIVVGWQPTPGEPLFEATALLDATAPAPVLVFTGDAGIEAADRALAAGIHGWVVHGYGARRLRPLVQLAQARFRRQRAERDALEDLKRRFEQRKLVDRAKGLLMRAHQVPEDEAFRRLRTASMQNKQRIELLSLQLIHASRDAECVNRAGQLRMLSQRLVKLYALEAGGSDERDARALAAQSAQRVRDNLEQLGRTLSQATFGDLYGAVQNAWRALEPLLAAPAAASGLGAIDAAAERLLGCADRLTAALEAAGSAASLRVVNLCGRQRMLSQRLAKQALIDALRGDGASFDSATAVTIEAFERALAELEAAPLGSAEIRAELFVATRDWQALRDAAARAADLASRRRIARLSESLLDAFERLTERYERALHALLA